MNQTPTTHPTVAELVELGRQIANDGYEHHEATITRIAAFARQSRAHYVAADVFGDQDAPSAARGRALGKLCQNWHDIVAANEDNDDFDSKFQTLLKHWNRHRSQRRQGDLDALWESRVELDTLRLETTEARRRLMLPS